MGATCCFALRRKRDNPRPRLDPATVHKPVDAEPKPLPPIPRATETGYTVPAISSTARVGPKVVKTLLFDYEKPIPPSRVFSPKNLRPYRENWFDELTEESHHDHDEHSAAESRSTKSPYHEEAEAESKEEKEIRTRDLRRRFGKHDPGNKPFEEWTDRQRQWVMLKITRARQRGDTWKTVQQQWGLTSGQLDSLRREIESHKVPVYRGVNDDEK